MRISNFMYLFHNYFPRYHELKTKEKINDQTYSWNKSGHWGVRDHRQTAKKNSMKLGKNATIG